MIKVAYLVSDFAAPSHTFVRREIAALRKLGLEVIPFTIRSARSSGEAEPLLGRSPLTYIMALLTGSMLNPARFVGGWRLSLGHRIPGIRGLLWSQFHFIEAVLLARRLRQTRAARLHNHFANSGATVGMIAAHIASIPWSVTLHGISETDHPAGMLLPEKLRRADFVSCASYFMRGQAMRLVEPSHWAKMHIVRCGIDIAELPVSGDGFDGPPSLICIGRIAPEKGYFGLLEALAALVARGVNFSLVVVGDGPASQNVKGYAAELGLSDHIRFEGALPEAETLMALSQSELLVLPSLMEGLPVVLVEALALGRPVLASRVAGIPELVEEGKSGLLFTPSDWNDLTAKLAIMIERRAEWNDMGRAGRSRVEQAFRIEVAAEALAHLFGAGWAR